MYCVSHFQKVVVDGPRLFYYIATVDGDSRFNMLSPMSATIDRIVTQRHLSDVDTFLLELRMRAARKQGDVKPQEDAGAAGNWIDEDDDDEIRVTIWVAGEDEPPSAESPVAVENGLDQPSGSGLASASDHQVPDSSLSSDSSPGTYTRSFDVSSDSDGSGVSELSTASDLSMEYDLQQAESAAAANLNWRLDN